MEYIIENYDTIISLLVNGAIHLGISIVAYLPTIIFLPLSIMSFIVAIVKRKNFKLRTIFLSILVISITAMISFFPISFLFTYFITLNFIFLLESRIL